MKWKSECICSIYYYEVLRWQSAIDTTLKWENYCKWFVWRCAITNVFVLPQFFFVTKTTDTNLTIPLHKSNTFNLNVNE